MGKSAWQYYGVKLIFQATITGEPIPERIDENYSDTHTFYEESIQLVHAQSFDHAYSIAERMGLEYRDEYVNVYGQTVKWALVEAVNCYLVGDKISNGEEVFSSISPQKRELTPSKYMYPIYHCFSLFTSYKIGLLVKDHISRNVACAIEYAFFSV